MIKRCQKGMTFLEAILSIALIGVGLIGILYIFSGATKSSLVANQTVIAANLAREKLEEIIIDRSESGYSQTIATNYSDGQLTGEYSEFTRSAEIVEVNPDIDIGDDDLLDSQAGSGYARVTVTVSWGNESVKLETLIADYTIQ